MSDTVSSLKLTHAGALKMLAAAVKKSEDMGVPQCIAIVDESANLLAFSRMDGAKVLSIDTATAKARMRPNGVRDGRWSPGFVRMARKTGAPVLPVHIDAHNSPLFYGVSMLAKPLSALLLAREMFGAQRMRIGFTIGQAIAPQMLEREGATPEQLAKAVRRHVYQLARRRPLVRT